MGWLDSLIGGAFGIATNERQIAANKQLQDDAQAHAAAMQEDSQEFNFAMQQDAQRYNSAEAEKAYNREVEFYEKYSSPKAQIASMMEAGVNPFSIAGSGSGPIARSSAASSGAASSGVGSVGAVGAGVLSNPLESILALARLKMDKQIADAQIGKTKAETENISADTVQINKNTEWIDRLNSMSVKESESVISKNAADILNSNADTQVKAAQLSEIAVGIANTEVDTSVKQQQFALLIAQTASEWKSIEQMTANISLMGTQAGLSRAQAKQLSLEWKMLSEKYSHSEIMNSLNEIVASRDSGQQNGYYRALSEVKRFLDSCLGWFSGSGSVSASVSSNTNNSTSNSNSRVESFVHMMN